jgi:hypothetical protein
VAETREAWIDALLDMVTVLEHVDIPHQLAGEAAAALYCVERPVHDVDFSVPAEHPPRVAAACADRLIRPPCRHRDEHWDQTLLALEAGGVRVEIAGADAPYRDARSGTWHGAAVDVTDATLTTVRGRVKVLPMARLREYKRRLDRAVERADCAALARGGA